MYWQLNLPSGVTWTTVKNMRCKVTVTASYYIEEKGNRDTNAVAAWGLYNSSKTMGSIVNGTHLHVKSAMRTTTFYCTVGDLFFGSTNGPYQAGAGVQVKTFQYPAPGAGQASAVIVGYSIVLQFPQAK